MEKSLYIDTTRMALTQDGRLREVYITATHSQPASLVGHIYVGRIQNILPGRFAFVDIGIKKEQSLNAFVNLPPGHGLKRGQPLLLQITKDAIGTKGPHADPLIRLKGRLVILHAGKQSIGVSGKITDPQERSRLLQAVKAALPSDSFSAIIRTNAMHQPAHVLAEEINDLAALHERITQQAQYAKPPVRLYPDHQHTDTTLLHDLLCDDLSHIWVEGPAYEAIKQAVEAIAPALVPLVQPYVSEGPGLFAEHGLESQLAKALAKEVTLPSGGHITIEQTEACAVIDVNTGSYSGNQNYRAVVLQTNLEAAATLAHQLALRNLSGIIIVDFIDMKEMDDRKALLAALTQAVQQDRIKTEVVGMTTLGLVQLTRRKTRPPLHTMLQKKCPHCGGVGAI